MSILDEVKAAQRLPAPDMARAIRKAAGVGQDRMARELGVHPVTLARWEAGTRAPRGDRRAAYAQLLVALQEAAR